jgi:hypothetical protein
MVGSAARKCLQVCTVHTSGPEREVLPCLFRIFASPLIAIINPVILLIGAPRVSERPPNRLAERITGRTYLSHSQISTMRSCPRKFAFLYVENAPADFIPSSLIFGGSIHSSLELHFRARLEGLETGSQIYLA